MQGKPLDQKARESMWVLISLSSNQHGGGVYYYTVRQHKVVNKVTRRI